MALVPPAFLLACRDLAARLAAARRARGWSPAEEATLREASAAVWRARAILQADLNHSRRRRCRARAERLGCPPPVRRGDRDGLHEDGVLLPGRRRA